MAASLRLQPLRESSPSPLEALAREPTAIAYNRDRPTQPTALTGGLAAIACSPRAMFVAAPWSLVAKGLCSLLAPLPC
ncbi:hypothetical protein MUK42_33652 [Musa troglodytarum]|uniref:Uncharacterized protein n=1 Tax=Musa troglodytarum TaxID=320322 RepID=A0A9E7JAH7_9LILI|nr:hypothetical protein MUK42_33652 [Musa troglodytarum]